jgi:hypothetical protein
MHGSVSHLAYFVISVSESLLGLEIHTYNLVISFLGIYPKEISSEMHKYLYTKMLVTALFLFVKH